MKTKLKKSVKKKLLMNIFSIIVLAAILLTIFEVLKLNILPNKYLTPLLIGEVALFLLGFLLYNLKKKFFIILGIILYLISIAGNIFGYYYLKQTNQYIEHNFAVETYKVTTHYCIVASVDDSVSSKDELTDQSIIEYYKYSRSIEKALAQLRVLIMGLNH